MQFRVGSKVEPGKLPRVSVHRSASLVSTRIESSVGWCMFKSPNPHHNIIMALTSMHCGQQQPQSASGSAGVRDRSLLGMPEYARSIQPGAVCLRVPETHERRPTAEVYKQQLANLALGERHGAMYTVDRLSDT